MRPFIKLIFASIFFVFFSEVALSQTATDSTKIYQVETKDGNKYYGKILEQNAEYVIIETEQLGTITLQTNNVDSIEEVEAKNFINGEYWADNLLSRRYFFGPNAFSLKKGEGYFQNSWIFLNQVSYGFSDHFTMGLGLIPTFLFGFGEGIPIWITPKFSFPLGKKVHAGFGGLYGTWLGESSTGLGITYGMVTLGNPNINATFGLGYGMVDGEWADRPTISVSAMSRASKRFYLMTENYILNDGFGLSFIGGRTVWDRVSLDYGLLIPWDTSGGSSVSAIPWLSLIIPFKPKRGI